MRTGREKCLFALVTYSRFSRVFTIPCSVWVELDHEVRLPRAFPSALNPRTSLRLWCIGLLDARLVWL